MNNVIVFNGKMLSDFDVFYDGTESFGIPEKDISFYSVPGKNGDLIISNGRYKNKTVPFFCFIKKDFRKNFEALMNFLETQEGYCRLEASAEPDVYCMATYSKEIDPRLTIRFVYGDFTLRFNRKPQKWLKSGEHEIEINDSMVLLNPTLQNAKPLIEITGTGTITINDSEMVLDENTSSVIVDCEMEDAYEGTINRNGNLHVTNGFPVLKAGENTVVVEGCSIKLTPRWWRL